VAVGPRLAVDRSSVRELELVRLIGDRIARIVDESERGERVDLLGLRDLFAWAREVGEIGGLRWRTAAAERHVATCNEQSTESDERPQLFERVSVMTERTVALEQAVQSMELPGRNASHHLCRRGWIEHLEPGGSGIAGRVALEEGQVAEPVRHDFQPSQHDFSNIADRFGGASVYQNIVMDEVRVPRRDLTAKPIIFPTGAAQLVVVERPCVHVIDVEDTHFAHDRCILLPDIAEADGSKATLDERRLTGLGVIYAALVHKDEHPDQKMLVVGHTDPSGAKSYNQELSEKRAKNVQLFVAGKRDDWRKHADEESHPDDVQHVLAFQARRAGWDCDPGQVTGKMDATTKKAIGRFQLAYNAEVDRAKQDGLDSPFKAKIEVDEDIGPNTWGAFFDIYCAELMRLFGLDKFADLQSKLAGMTGFDGVGPSIGCGEHIPFQAGRREAFVPTEKLVRPQHNPADRRVEIMFFDPEEKPDLKCHAGGGCNAAVCPLYTKEEYCHREIGVPKGLKIGEVVMEMRFEDPEGNTHLLPKGVEVEVRFDDGSTQTHVLLENAIVSFVTARDKTSFDLAITTEDGQYVVLVPGKDGAAATTELLDREKALAKMNEGAKFFLLPKAFDTHDADWRVPDTVSFEEGRFIDLDSPATEIGTRGAPAEIVLTPRWQHFRFEFFDRWRNKPTTVPQPRPRSEETPPLVLEGHLGHVDYENGPKDPAIAEAVWDVDVEGETLHCLPWVHRRPAAANGRVLPDKECLSRFVFPKSTWVRVDGDADAEKPLRMMAIVTDKHQFWPDVSKASAARLRYYDLPEQWWSRGWYTRLASDDAKSTKKFEEIDTTSSKDAPYVIDLDQIVLSYKSEGLAKLDGTDDSDALQPFKILTWKDDDADRFTIWDSNLKVHKPHADDTYFSDLAKQAPAPQGAVVVDHAPFTRLITRGNLVFDVFDLRTPLVKEFADVPVGARMGRRYTEAVETPFFSFDPSYKTKRADDTNGSLDIGDIPTMVLRCCAHNKDLEYFRVAQYASVFFDFAPKELIEGASPLDPPVGPDDALKHIRKSLIASMNRWNGVDKSPTTLFEIGQKDAPEARGVFNALLVRGDASSYYNIQIVSNYRAGMDRKAAWELADMHPYSDGRFAAAHEWGHAFGNPDHYIEGSYWASLGADGINDRARSPGCPYAFDTNGMMSPALMKTRAYDFWHLVLWMVQKGHSFSERRDIAVLQGNFRYTTETSTADKSRALFPIVSKVQQKIGSTGLVDFFAYAGGVDGFNGGDSGKGMEGATPTEPWDIVVVVRVHMAMTLSDAGHRGYTGGAVFVSTVQATIQRVFNDSRRLVARGTFEGREVRARFIFSPRFVVRTYPIDSSAAKKKYIAGLRYPVTNQSSYDDLVKKAIEAGKLHCEVTAVKEPRKGGLTDGSASPRKGTIDTSKIEDTVVDLFGKLIGLANPATATENDYAPLADLLGPQFSRSKLEFVP
jgi:hypothetical protein